MEGLLYDIPGRNSGYIFTISNKDGSHASLYVSKSDLFTFTITDIYGSTYDLEAKFDKDELPSEEFVMLHL
jgi:hypothetical protein